MPKRLTGSLTELFTTLSLLVVGCGGTGDVASIPSSASMPDSPLLAEDRAIAAFVRKGGNLSVDGQGQIVSIYFSDTEFNAVELANLTAFRNLRELNLATCHVDDSIWQHLRDAKELESLTLWGAAITDSGLENLRRFPNLKSLDLRATSIGDTGLASVAHLKSLEKLEILGTRVTGAGMSHLRGLSKLKELGLVQTAVDDEGLRHIRHLTGLTELSLEGTKITNEGLVHIGQLTNLTLLTIHNTQVNENGLVHLERLANLKTFYLCVPVGNTGLQSLMKMKRLADLYIGDANSDSRQFLQSHLPDVGVY